MNLFSQEGKLASFLNRIGDLIILNILSVICCIPVVTAGAAVSAMYYVTLKMIRGEEGKIASSFLAQFKNNLRFSAPTGICGMALAALISLDLWFIRDLPGTFGNIYRGALIVCLIIVFLMTLFILVAAGYFENTAKQTIKNGMLFCMINPVRSLGVGIVTLVPAALVMLTPRMLFVIVLLGLSGPAYLNSLYFRRLFEKFSPETEGSEKEQNL